MGENYSMVQSEQILNEYVSKWELIDFKELIEDVSSGNKKLKKSEYLEKGDLPVVDQGQELISGYTDEEDAVEANPPYIVFGDHTRIFKEVNFKIALGADGVKLLKIRKEYEEECDYKYIYYFLQALDIPDTGYNRHYKYLKNIKIPLPSLSEQKAIVAKLDRAQRLITIDKEMLAKYDELIQSVFLEMFGDPVTNPKGWEMKKLGRICIKITDGTHHSPDTFENEEFPYITAKHVDPFKVDFYSNPSYVTREDHKKIYSRCNPEQGDVLLIKDGATTGKAAINPYEFEFSMLSSLALLKLNENQLRGNYLINVLNDKRYKDLIRQKYMSGVAIKRYTLKKINQFEIPVPKIELQKRFDEIVANINVEKQKTLESSKNSEKLFSSLVHGAFG